MKIKRIANNGRPETNIPIFTKMLFIGQSAMSHLYSLYFQYPPKVNGLESETYISYNTKIPYWKFGVNLHKSQIFWS